MEGAEQGMERWKSRSEEWMGGAGWWGLDDSTGRCRHCNTFGTQIMKSTNKQNF